MTKQIHTHHVVPTVSYELAARAVETGIRLAAAVDIKAVVTVADPGMAMVAYGRSDGATPHSAETSRRKAATSASTRKPSSAIAQEMATKLENGTGGLITSIKGGLPLVFSGVHIGGIGVAGGPPDQDEKIALALLEELGADPVATA